ncbi:MAG: DUF6361 family protein [Thermoleophilaceae bacterium]
MSSKIAWLDQSDEHQRQMREAIGMFRDEGAVDELGMGRIRDAFSDRLFPGTSVLWRRARYLLFVPWIYLLIERGKGGRRSGEEQARQLQRRLARSLGEAGEAGRGVIGVGGADVKQPPDVILWAALKTWGVRLDSGKLSQVRASAAARGSRGGQLEDEVVEDSIWHPRVSRLMPDGFPTAASFDLELDEAKFLAELIDSPDALPGTPGAARADSLLAALLRDGLDADVEFPWLHSVPSASPALADALHHAGCISDVLHGARLLYAHLAAESQKDDDLRDAVQDVFPEWVDLVERRRDELSTWVDGLDDFFALVRGINRNVGRKEQSFVAAWAGFALADPATLRDNVDARKLIVEREAHAKGLRKARLRLDGSVGRDAAAVLPDRLTFRWGQARWILDDIARGLESSRA